MLAVERHEWNAGGDAASGNLGVVRGDRAAHGLTVGDEPPPNPWDRGVVGQNRPGRQHDSSRPMRLGPQAALKAPLNISATVTKVMAAVPVLRADRWSSGTVPRCNREATSVSRTMIFTTVRLRGWVRPSRRVDVVEEVV